MNETLLTTLYCLMATWPLLCAALIRDRGTKLRGSALALTASWPAFATALYASLATPLDQITVASLLLGASWSLDETRAQFLLLTSLVWAMASLQSRWCIAREQQARFYRFFLLAMSGNFFLCFADDIVSFYTAYALMSFTSYGLINFTGNPASRAAGTRYIVFMLVSELLLFAALALAHPSNGNEQLSALKTTLAQHPSHWPALLMFIAFGIKCGVLGLHFWLPPAHSSAPSPVSAVLSGVMLKAGILGWIMLLPLGLVSFDRFGDLVVVLGLCGCFYGAALGVLQNHPKRLLAYSSISQMGLFVVATGLAISLPQWRREILAFIACLALHHGFNKGALFLATEWLTADKRCQNWLMWSLLLIPSLALAGFPWLSGMLAKGQLKVLLHEPAFERWVWITWWLPWVSCATSLLMARFQYLIMPQTECVAGLRKYWAPWLVLVLSAQLATWALYSDGIPIISSKTLWASAWPVLLAAFLAPVCARSSHLKLTHSRLSKQMTTPRFILSACQRAAKESLASYSFTKQKAAGMIVSIRTLQNRMYQLNCPKIVDAERVFGAWTFTTSLLLAMLLTFITLMVI